ncbi:MAG: Aspartyl/glutamyl-tRNA(Asn/Gln) amidotransferase subunit C [Microgenomates group bacterium GW2011_GWC1_39_7b]|uniref:Aspartyl/glutamyl-tRNA(Asn/Gln) amidotransferase subunit C n=3 Tax=Candidatus Woeseibacteriota TaxID=1752722 RepID=A0A0G0P0U0_9BACT|nr:MAG: Aspartyl/glutamyl-tRNA(Asn/Gln) amidotransferase subunit C [Candidatus Woesebacteria bacterium GW2011_GWB1_39_10]KKR26737.1 MAG: Aspartyl/glutamyl-tRNA(Asn/Gln) amidotransferase subunit C [Microgenomates group bacterium GW2011_GWC1_39_7b]KKR73668.1 MAG: Aspartyl/glutamyl-tRNA(Asn/Gln) amidotransferase subunit C [Candidatus Woesebacteria bacterium GW2011_GWA2_40_7]KKS90691.1 MAG: Aspartyl/glutamyl-tRNA(Asn/Gln) amidotransferase subunit C [Candidatus Woesebacteria bacterium GW2011_GWA1_43_
MDMAKLSKADVTHVARLAKLDLTDTEINKFLPQLSQILEHVGELGKVDTTDLTPTSQTAGLTNVLREDEVKPSSIDQNGALSGTNKTHNGYFKVDAILTERSDK